MAKTNINSEVQLIPNSDSKRRFFTTSTVEDLNMENGNKVKHTRIYEEIDEKTYNDIKLDDVLDSQGDNRVFYTEASNGTKTYIRLIKDGENYSPYADENLQKELAKTGKSSFFEQLETGQDDALKKAAGITDPDDTTFLEQLPGFKGAVDAANKFLDGLNFSSGDVPLSFQGRRQTEYENLFYPETIAKSKQDRIRFSMRYISGSRDINFNLQNGGGSIGLGTRNFEGINGSVTLPIPGGISDSNKVKFDADSLDVVGALGFGAALNPVGAVEAGVDLLNKALSSDDKALVNALGGETGSNLISALRIRLAETAMGKKGMFSRIGGGILNPNMELLFQAPGMRVFNFSFTMSARSRTEATQIKKIIRFFKQGMSVKRSTNNIFIVSPNTFKINYILGNTGDNHPSIGRIKECALTDLNTTYGNGSTYMTFDDPDRTLTTYKIDMTFKELEPITEDDYLSNTGPLADPDEAFQVDTNNNAFPGEIGY